MAGKRGGTPIPEWRKTGAPISAPGPTGLSTQNRTAILAQGGEISAPERAFPANLRLAARIRSLVTYSKRCYHTKLAVRL